MIKKLLLPIALIFGPTEIFAQEWAVIDRSGIVRFVYVAPEGLKDKQFVAQVLHAIMRQEVGLEPKASRWRGAAQIMLFDDRRYTPRGFPMTDKQMLHYRARYNYNPSTRLEEFAWVFVVNAKVSPPKLKESKDHIRPGTVE